MNADVDSYSKKILGLSVGTGMMPAPTASPLDVVSIVINLMIRENTGSVVVLENNKPVGIVTERDVFSRELFRPEKT